MEVASGFKEAVELFFSSRSSKLEALVGVGVLFREARRAVGLGVASGVSGTGVLHAIGERHEEGWSAQRHLKGGVLEFVM